MASLEASKRVDVPWVTLMGSPSITARLPGVVPNVCTLLRAHASQTSTKRAGDSAQAQRVAPAHRELEFAMKFALAKIVLNTREKQKSSKVAALCSSNFRGSNFRGFFVFRVLASTSRVCFFVLCNQHWFNKAPGPDPRGPSWGLPIYPSLLAQTLAVPIYPYPYWEPQSTSGLW